MLNWNQNQIINGYKYILDSDLQIEEIGLLKRLFKNIRVYGSGMCFLDLYSADIIIINNLAGIIEIDEKNNLLNI